MTSVTRTKKSLNSTNYSIHIEDSLNKFRVISSYENTFGERFVELYQTFPEGSFDMPETIRMTNGEQFTRWCNKLKLLYRASEDWI